MQRTSFAAAILLLTFAGVAHAANSVKATVNGMVCAFCAQGIEKRIGKMEATKAVLVDLKRKTVVVEARDGMSLDTKAIAAEITDSGYDVVKFEPSQKSVEEFKAELKGRK
jgi:mercuric ion binding protein